MEPWYASRYTGLLQRSGPVPLRPHDPAVPMWFGSLVPWGPRGEPLAVGGAGWDRGAAEASALGEAIERWQPYPLARDATVEASFAQWPLAEPAVAPERWVLFHAEQYAQAGFPYWPFTRDTVCRWTCFRQVPSGDPCWVPEDLAFLYARGGERHTICPGVSTGLSCGRVGQPVLLRGLQEAIERDAVVGVWWDRYRLEEWDGRTVLDALGTEIAERLRRPNLRYRAFRVASPFSAHVTVVTLEGEDREGACFSVGSACRETRRESWLKALLEAVQGRHYVRHLKRERGATSGELLDFADHALYYSLHPERLPETVLHRAKPATADAEESTVEDSAVLTGRLGEGRPVLFRNVTPPMIAQEVGDWYVLKVLVPGLQPLHGNARYPHLGGPLWAPRGLADFAPLPPHPFP
jgi:thiazole/oxazole-forming peptide maturase SagD family component